MKKGPWFDAWVDTQLAALKVALPKASGTERRRLLLRGLNFCNAVRPLPRWLFEALSEDLVADLQPTKDEKRWCAVRVARDEQGFDWETRTPHDADGQTAGVEDGTFDWAAEALAGTDAAGTPRTMRHSYDKVEHKLRPKGLGRPRTYRRRRRRSRSK